MRWLMALLFALCLAAGCGDDTDTDIGTEGLTAGECTDGEDNDEDGEVDCNDRGCEGGPDCDQGGW